jgi:hypothetical protein
MKEAFKIRRPVDDRAGEPESFSQRSSRKTTVSIRRLSAYLATPRGMLVGYAVALCVVGLFYSFYTAQIWEDCLITLRHSENLLKGNGLTYNPGERVHGFTSPINVLLLAVCHLLTGQSSYIATCWLYRLFTIAAFAGSGVLLVKAFLAMTPRWTPAAWFVGIMYLFDGKSVAFSTNGMETGFMLASVAWAFYLLTQTQRDQWLMRGLCWAALMWSRPDGCLYITLLSLAELIFGQAPRRDTIISLAKSAGICLLTYGPWVAWAWGYYGSPIPHTVIAKGNIDNGNFTQLLRTVDNLITKLCLAAADVFRPVYYGEDAGWIPQAALGRIVNGLTKGAGIFCLIYWLFPTADRWGRMASFCFAGLCLYFSYMTLAFPWYYPPAVIFGLIALGRGLTQLMAAARQRTSARANWLQFNRRALLAWAVIVLLCVNQVMLFGLMSRKERIQQAEIEMGNRKVIGEWLKANGRPYESVYLEPLGYIGYFSGMKMIDYPGLVAPEVVKARKEKRGLVDRITIIPELRPDWVVLRFNEYQYLTTTPIADRFRQEYSFVEKRNVSENLNAYGFLCGAASLQYDSAFAIFRRNPSALGPSALPPAGPTMSAPAGSPVN